VLKEKIIALAQRHRRYGVGMIYLKLRQAGELINHKRVDRLYAEAGLQVKKLKRKKIPLSDRHPLERPTAANQVWSMDFVFVRTAEGRSIKSLTVVDDATHEAVAIMPERALGGNQLVRILEQIACSRGLPPGSAEDAVLAVHRQVIGIHGNHHLVSPAVGISNSLSMVCTICCMHTNLRVSSRRFKVRWPDAYGISTDYRP